MSLGDSDVRVFGRATPSFVLDEDLRAVIDALDPATEYSITGDLAPFARIETEFGAAAGATTWVELPLFEGVSSAGTVVDDADFPLEGVDVHVRYGNSWIQTYAETRTDEEGNFAFDALKPVEGSVRFRKRGYKTRYALCFDASSQTEPLRIVLTPR